MESYRRFICINDHQMKQQLHQEAQMIAVKHLEAWKMYDINISEYNPETRSYKSEMDSHKSWAKEKGYVVSRDKSGDENNPYHYEWHLKSDSTISGITNSLSQVATDIFNHLTDNKHVEYQQKVKQELADKIQDDVYFDQGL